MARNLAKSVSEWAKANHCEVDFWSWRDAMNLVTHEDTDCRIMHLVYSPTHIAFKHRGGVANAINIKINFNC